MQKKKERKYHITNRRGIIFIKLFSRLAEESRG